MDNWEAWKQKTARRHRVPAGFLCLFGEMTDWDADGQTLSFWKDSMVAAWYFWYISAICCRLSNILPRKCMVRLACYSRKRRVTCKLAEQPPKRWSVCESMLHYQNWLL